MKIPFLKMHGLGNDYVFLDEYVKIPDPAGLARRMSPRRTSVGADGIVLYGRGTDADATMRIFNADGSEGETCGNALRCLGKYLWESGRCRADAITVRDRAGRHVLMPTVERGRVTSVEVSMGKPTVSVREETALGERVRLICASVGNPHAVLFVPDPEKADVAGLGAAIEHLPCFPARTNVEFAAVTNETHLRMRVWERGSGETFACGSGAVAVAFAAVSRGDCPAETPISVSLRGGTLVCTVKSDGEAWLGGPAAFVYEGVYDDGEK